MTPSEILTALIAIPSVNPMDVMVDDHFAFESHLSDWLVDFFESIGAPTERIEVAKNRANVIAKFDSPCSQKTVLIDVHQDTVPVDEMTIEPFLANCRDGKIFGRGAADVKGGMAAILHAFARLHRERPNTADNVVVCCSCDEESTIIGVRDLVTYWTRSVGRSRLLNKPPDAAIVAEPTMLHAVVAHLGVLRFRVHTHGKACHSSDPSQGENAIYKMSRIVTRLHELALTLPAAVPHHAQCGSAAMSVGKIDGGTSVNIVPAKCTIEIDRRLVPGERTEDVFEALVAEIHHIDPTATCDCPWVSTPALGDHDNHDLADRMLRIVAKVERKHDKIGVAYCTHASTISETGIATIVFGPGSIEQAHTANEFIDVQQLDLAAECYYQFCANGNL